MSAKAEYAVRAMVQLATVAEGELVKTDDLAKAQGIPAQFLVDILTALRTDRLVRSHRGRDGGYELARPAGDISIADVLRCIDGPLASVRDIGLGDLPYSGPTAALTDVWRACGPACARCSRRPAWPMWRPVRCPGMSTNWPTPTATRSTSAGTGEGQPPYGRVMISR
ncbi:BadM/Rrf2 family transcriptional regulator [Mycolicibacterium conceptionense]|uniref:BadM/Rrf2 family transcriptional regulator n=1 Tax=Mycolicibacterium conceptionense TaxID=451644 RepID=A0A0U1DLE9_9MYCO|nr:BadM/Rrf2 family transcriptional regulator [Mycolicibacterium conceptionense]